MHHRARYWLYGGMALVLVVLGVVALLMRSGGDERSIASDLQPTARDAAAEAASEEADEAIAASDDVGEESQEEAEPAPVTVNEKPLADPAHLEDDEPLDEERFVEVAAKIRLWQQTLTDTPEGHRKLDDLVRELLNSERLTPSDLEAFGEMVGAEAMDRLDARIDKRVTEFGQRRYSVEAKQTKGTRVIAQGEPEGSEGDEEP
jgi:hypothetical protein